MIHELSATDAILMGEAAKALYDRLEGMSMQLGMVRAHAPREVAGVEAEMAGVRTVIGMIEGTLAAHNSERIREALTRRVLAERPIHELLTMLEAT